MIDFSPKTRLRVTIDGKKYCADVISIEKTLDQKGSGYTITIKGLKEEKEILQGEEKL